MLLSFQSQKTAQEQYRATKKGAPCRPRSILSSGPSERRIESQFSFLPFHQSKASLKQQLPSNSLPRDLVCQMLVGKVCTPMTRRVREGCFQSLQGVLSLFTKLDFGESIRSSILKRPSTVPLGICRAIPDFKNCVSAANDSLGVENGRPSRLQG